MRLLVTGGAGFIGSALIRLAIARGHTVLNFDKLTYAANLAALESVQDSDRYSFIKADICDRSQVTAALESFRPDAVLNLAAETHVDRSIDSSDAFIQTNINGVHTLLEAARTWLTNTSGQQGFRFVHVSTDEVFGSIAEGAFNETSPYRPNSPYSAAKASSDMLVRAWTETFGFPGLVTNCSNNYGAWQFPEKFIPNTILKVLRGEQIPVYGDGQQVRDWLYVDDHAAALLRVAEAGQTGATYCIGGGAEINNLSLAQKIADMLDAAGEGRIKGGSRNLIEFVEDRPGHDRRYAIDNRYISRELGWKPAHDFDQGLAETVAWYLDHRGWLQSLAETGQAGQRLGILTKGKQ